jgi:hypothetical protein
MNNYKSLKITVCLIVLGIFLTLFLPCYEGFTYRGNENVHQFGLIKIYFAPEVEFVEVLSGFGSFFGLSNIFFQAILAISVLFFPRSIGITITFISFFVISVFLVFVGNSAGFGGPICDRMLIGYYFAFPLTIINLFISLYININYRKTNPKHSGTNESLLDSF